jgi:DNA repair protein RecN (Recombination protein N)
LAQVGVPLENAAAIDEALAPLAERLDALRFEAEDLSAELRRYGLESEVAPGRLEEVEDRYGLLSRLARKYRGTLSDVLRHQDDCAHRREQLQDADERLAAVERRLAQVRDELAGLSGSLSEVRREAAPQLAAAVRERLAELAMAEARFEVVVTPRAGGCGPRGGDAVEMTIAPNPGMPQGPLREIASGGELSRVMLALLSVAHGEGQGAGGDDSLLVFDEVDAGIGGHTARAVGEHLRVLAQGRQVLCITHLPQVAALAARHFTIVKSVGSSPARTEVRSLDSDGVVGELVRMLGAETDDRAADEHARSLLRAAA